MSIDISDLKGYKECRVTPVKNFEFHGMPVTRIDIYCFTNSGQVFQNSCVGQSGMGVITIFQLLAEPVKVVKAGAVYSIDAGGYKEFTLQCK